MNFDFARVFEQLTPLLWQGLYYTLYVSFVSIVAGMIVGLISCFMIISRYRILRILSGTFVWVIRGTPMLVQAMFFFFGVPQVLRMVVPGINETLTEILPFAVNIPMLFTPVQAGILTVALNAGAYFTEIFRAGINAVDKGQNEAARSLGLTQWKTMYKVILPQALRISLPPSVNQWIISVKDTSLLSAIGVGELMQQTRIYAGRTMINFESFIYVALWYLAILSVLMILAKKLETWVTYDRKN
ncbi:MAG: amino acid ABC transporter permease [Defluviitaleaceae bacterium]|nr:amino acid ABC transporter permease [Defluviitaleaceae bacterium]MCL2263182.1 amino acid ABC transporter permease [Defluviitaleaceae bacterium]